MRWRLVCAVVVAGSVLGVGVPGLAAAGGRLGGVDPGGSGWARPAGAGVLGGAGLGGGGLSGAVGLGLGSGGLDGGGGLGGAVGERVGGGLAERAAGAVGGSTLARSGLLFDLAFRVVNINSGKCLTVTGGGLADGAILIQKACSADPSYRWRFMPVLINGSPSFMVMNVRSGKCASVRADGTAVQLGCDGDAGRRWRLLRRPGVPATMTTSDALAENLETRKCLTIAGGSVAENAVAVQDDCDGERSRRWTVRLATGLSTLADRRA